MRFTILLLIGASAVCAQGACEARGQELLFYSPRGKAARVQGTVVAQVKLNAEGEISSFQIQPGGVAERFLAAGVLRFLHQARFPRGCEQQIHELRFEFSLGDESKTFIYFEAPNTYRIVCNRLPLMYLY